MHQERVLESAIDADAHNAGHEAAVQPSDAVGLECLLVHIDEASELALAAFTGAFAIGGETCARTVRKAE